MENPDTAAGDGDYYANIWIGGVLQTTFPGVIEDDTFNPKWLKTRTLDWEPNTTIPIAIELKDHDTGPTEGGDDVMDIDPTPSTEDDEDNKDPVHVILHLEFNPATGTWTGDVTARLLVVMATTALRATMTAASRRSPSRLRGH